MAEMALAHHPEQPHHPKVVMAQQHHQSEVALTHKHHLSEVTLVPLVPLTPE